VINVRTVENDADIDTYLDVRNRVHPQTPMPREVVLVDRLKPDHLDLIAERDGIPVGAALVSEEVASRLSPGDHGSTYGGNLLACRAGLYFVDQLLSGGLLADVTRVGNHLGRKLTTLAGKHAIVREVRGRGLMWGLDLDRPAAAVVDAAREGGLLVNATAKTVVRLLPPLTITETEVDEAVSRLDAALGAAARS